MEVLSRDRELTILVDSESQRDIEQTDDRVGESEQGLSCGHFNHTKGIADHSCGGNAWNFSTHFVEIGS